jgi:methyl-accepting chemotaxis protein
MQISSSTVTLIFIIAIAVGVLLQALILLAMLVAGLKAARRAEALSNEMKTHLLPILASTRHLLEDVAPRVKEAAANLSLATEELRTQAEHIHSALDGIVEKTRVQVDRLDEMLSGVLNGVDYAVNTVQHTMAKPMRQFSGVFNGLRAGLDTLLSKDRKSHVAEDKDLFV